jgi:hypothetical protein
MDRSLPEEANFGKEVGYRLLLGMVWAGLAVALVSHFWAANRGLEMTDEASYLLLALDPWNTMGHGSLHGFFLHPLYLLGGSSVAGLRILGFAFTLAAAARLAVTLGKFLEANGRPGMKDWHPWILPVLMISSLTYLNAGIRTPCYNWLVLVGGMLVWSGWFRFQSAGKGWGEAGLGLFLIWGGKWSSWIVLVPVLLLASGISGRWKREKAFWSRIGVVFLIMTAVFLIFFVGRDALLSSWAAGRIFQETTGTHGFHLLPKYLWEMIYYIYRVGRAFVWLLPPILLLSWWRRENPGLWSVQKIAGVLFLTGFSLAAARGWWRGGYDQFGKESVLAGCWLLGVAWTVWAVNRGADIKEGISKIGGEELVLGNLGLVAGGSIWFFCALVLTPFLLGFGTATSVADFAGQGTVFFAAAGVWLLGSTRPTLRILGWGLPALVLTGLGLLQASRVATSLSDLYRIGDIRSQNTAVDFGPEKGRLWVDSGLAAAVAETGAELARESFSPGDPVIGVDALCGLVYLLGAKSAGACWYFQNQEDYLRWMVARLDPAVLKKSVVIRRSSSVIWPSDQWLGVPLMLTNGSPIAVRMDRGSEMVLVYFLKNR